MTELELGSVTLSQRTTQPSSSDTQAGVDPGDVFVLPTSFGEERFWGLDRANPGNPTWMVPVRFRLQGTLDCAFIERAFNEIVRRHETLRTTFTVRDGQPAQVIRSTLTIQVPLTDLRHLPKLKRDAEVDRLSFKEARWRFDLAVGPLFRVSLLRVDDNEHVMLVTPHHSVADYWSIGLISNELGALYEAYSRQSEPILPELPVQYGDFAVWQREQSTGAVVQEELAYWKEQLKNLPLLEFPTDRPRPSIPTYEATITSILLPVNLTEAVRNIATREGATFFNTMLAALAILLQQYTQQTDFGVATQVAGRTTVELEPLIGMFVNNVVLRMDLSGNPSFSELLGRVQEVSLQSLAHQNLRFEQLLKELRPNDYPSHHTLFRINFICQRDPVKPLEFAGIKLTVIPSKSQGALYDLNVFLVLRNEGWRLACEFNTDLYEASTITRLLNNYRKLLETIIENPNRRLSEFPLLDGVTPPRQQEAAPESAIMPSDAGASGETKVESQGTSTEFYAMPSSPPQQRFWLLEKLTPGNRAFYMPACVRLTGPLSHATLEKSFQVMVNRHETLRTTFAEVKNELMQVIAPSLRFSLPLTSIEDIPEPGREARLQELIHLEATENFDLVSGPLFRARLFRVFPEEHVLVITVHHILADAWSQSIIQQDLWSIFEALTEGREPALAPLEIQYSDFTTWQREWLASAEARKHLDFWTKQLTLPLPVLDLPTDRPLQAKPASQGAMETTLLPGDLTRQLKTLSQSEDVTMFMLMLASFGILLSRYTREQDILIGSPVANRRPETGPLIGPFAGPLALRLNLSGNPSFREILHRVRDVSLEALVHTELPFEVLVESLRVHAVRRRNPLFQFYFFYQTAFLQPRRLRDLRITPLPDFSLGTPFELQLGLMERAEGLRAQLEYNPDLFDSATIQQILDFYVDLLRTVISNPEKRVADLPAPGHGHGRVQPSVNSELRREYVAPRDSSEMQLALIWEKVLQRDRVGVHDNFFDLGGTSLLAARMVTEVAKIFQRKIDLSTLLTAPTVEKLALHLERDEGSKHSSVVPIQPLGSKPPLFCVHGGGGHVLRFRAMAARLDPDQPFYGLRAPEIDGATNQITVEELAARYVRDIRTVQEHGPYYLSGASFGGLVAFEMASQLVERGEKIALLALFDTGNPAHYRNLSISEMARFRALYFLERFQKYGGLLARGKIWQSGRELAGSLSARASSLIWKIAQKFYRLRQHPMPTALRDNVRLFNVVRDAYTPRQYPGRILLFRAAGRTAEYGNDPALGWEEVIRGGIEIFTVPGDHMTILEVPYVWSLVELLGTCLDRARAEQSLKTS